MTWLTQESFDPAAELEAFTKASPGAGGIVSFLGLVRPTSEKGFVKKLHLQAYPAMTISGIQNAIDTAHKKWPLISAKVIHRIGDVFPGEPIVFVGTAAAHRRDAFEAADYLMDYLKTEAVFWKREVTDNGDHWIEPREADYADVARWKDLETISP